MSEFFDVFHLLERITDDPSLCAALLAKLNSMVLEDQRDVVSCARYALIHDLLSVYDKSKPSDGHIYSMVRSTKFSDSPKTRTIHSLLFPTLS
jgi:hypothetical protein